MTETVWAFCGADSDGAAPVAKQGFSIGDFALQCDQTCLMKRELNTGLFCSSITSSLRPWSPQLLVWRSGPMNNREIQAAWKYHDGTKHSYWSVRNRPHFLDWANRPLPFKIYPKIEPLPLPRDVPQTGVAALSAISKPVPLSRADSVPGVQDLTRLLYFSAGITKQRAYPGGEIYFRAAACTGALYEIELYVVAGDLPACITLIRPMYRYGFCERVIFAETWLRQR